MRCVICGSALPDGPSSRCPVEGCKAPLCPGEFGVECLAAHRKQLHLADIPTAATSVAGYVKGLKTQLKAAEGRAVVAEGLVIHWKATNNATDLNWKAKFGALVKFMKAACPDQLKRAERDGLAKESDILPEA